MRQLRHVCWGLLLVGGWLVASADAQPLQDAAHGVAQPAPATSAPSSDASAQVAPAGVARDLTLKQMGVYGAIKLRGQDPNGTLNVAVRNDEVVTGAKLRLVYTYSPSLIYSLSHLKVFLNGEVVATLPLDKEQAGQTVSKDVVLDPRLFTDFNRIGVQMIAHYSLDHCEDPYHTSLWTDISPDTTLTLTTSEIGLPNSLALLPAPFFDRRDNRSLVVPFLLPAHADAQTLRAAGVVSSWFGALAGWRGARFPVAQTPPTDGHAIAFALPNAMPEGVKLGDIKGPTVIVMANPASPPQSGRKLLVLAGRDTKELQEAANALVIGQVGMSGDQAIVKSVDLGPERRPYDAPNWAPVDRPVSFKELVTDPAQLEAAGFNPQLQPVRALHGDAEPGVLRHQRVPVYAHGGYGRYGRGDSRCARRARTGSTVHHARTARTLERTAGPACIGGACWRRGIGARPRSAGNRHRYRRGADGEVGQGLAHADRTQRERFVRA